jgi:hypothetical protein
MDALQAGITAAREGRRAEARALLQQALQTNPRSEQGWLWMSAVVETDAERSTCLERVLTINPHNQTAHVGLEKLRASSSPDHGAENYLPASQPPSPQGGAPVREHGQTPGVQMPVNPVARPPSPHTMPTLGMSPVTSDSRPIQLLTPQPDAEDGLAQLRAAQLQPLPSSSPEPSSQSDNFMALVLIGGLSITAIGGTLMLILLWIIGWPP